MHHDKPHKTISQRLFSGSLWALFTMFVWELVEEGIETLIAFCISEVVALFVVKALSALAIIGATQGIKVCIKRFLVPVIKTLTYKEGFDKMSKIKQFFALLFANKKTLGGTIGALASSVLTAYATYGGYFSFLPPLMWLGFNWTALIVGVVCFVLIELGVTGKGFEKIADFAKRVAEKKSIAEQKAIDKEALKEIKNAEKVANQTQVEQEKADAKAEAEKKAKAEKEAAEAEHRKKVEEAKARILAEKGKKA